MTLLDAATVDRIRALGGLAAIAISHPHYYTTHRLWARTFGCPVYLAAEDRRWLAQDQDQDQDQEDPSSSPGQQQQIFLAEDETERALLSPAAGATLLKPGGHFPGSMVLLFGGHLLVADTLVTTPAGLGSWAVDAAGRPRGDDDDDDDDGERRRTRHLGGRPEGMNTFAFMWSIPNMIPLSPAEIARMWDVLGRHEFVSTHGAFLGQEVEDVRVKARVLESMKIQVARMGWTDHPLLSMDV